KEETREKYSEGTSRIEALGKTLARNGRVRSMAAMREHRERFCASLARSFPTVARMGKRLCAMRRGRSATRLSGFSPRAWRDYVRGPGRARGRVRSEEHTSELQSRV